MVSLSCCSGHLTPTDWNLQFACTKSKRRGIRTLAGLTLFQESPRNGHLSKTTKKAQAEAWALQLRIRRLRDRDFGASSVGAELDRSGRRGAGSDFLDVVGLTHNEGRHRVVLQIGGDVGGGGKIAGALLQFERPLILRAFNDAEVVDDRVQLGCFTSFHEVGNRDRRQQTNDGHNDHDFHEREAGLTVCLDLHSCFCLSYYLFCLLRGVNYAKGGLLLVLTLFTDIAFCNRVAPEYSKQNATVNLVDSPANRTHDAAATRK